jgi:hypothetical protein
VIKEEQSQLNLLTSVMPNSASAQQKKSCGLLAFSKPPGLPSAVIGDEKLESTIESRLSKLSLSNRLFLKRTLFFKTPFIKKTNKSFCSVTCIGVLG